MCMARIVLAGTLERYPSLRILTHHSGGMIPTFGQRVGANPVGFQGPEHAAEQQAFQRLPHPPQAYFKRFFADTTVGAVARTLRASIDFFGVDHVLFGTDWPFGPATEEEASIAPTVSALREGLNLSPAGLEQILGNNARRLLGVTT